MTLKVIISLPNNAAITLEASDPQLCHEVIGRALRELPLELAQLSFTGPSAKDEKERDSSVAAVHLAEERDSSLAAVHLPKGREGSGGPIGVTSGRVGRSERAFGEFCSGLSPVGDMRRVVVAAEGARRLLETLQISPRELEELFQLAGWPKPKDMVQTLRNAARSSFRWLERVPGRQGYYTVSERGRREVMG